MLQSHCYKRILTRQENNIINYTKTKIYFNRFKRKIIISQFRHSITQWRKKCTTHKLPHKVNSPIEILHMRDIHCRVKLHQWIKYVKYRYSNYKLNVFSNNMINIFKLRQYINKWKYYKQLKVNDKNERYLLSLIILYMLY
jgi:hypothetical protein